MTVQELIEKLNNLNPDAQIRFATQPAELPNRTPIRRFPLEYSLSGPIEVKDKEGFPTVYLLEKNQIGFFFPKT